MKILLFAKLVRITEHRLMPLSQRAYLRSLQGHVDLTQWAKFITATDYNCRGGYAFIGPWINRGYTRTSTLKLPTPVLVSLEHCRPQSRETYRTYTVLVIHSSGQITDPGIEADDLTYNWAHRILPHTHAILEDLAAYDKEHDHGPITDRIRLKPMPTLSPRFSKPQYRQDWR